VLEYEWAVTVMTRVAPDVVPPTGSDIPRTSPLVVRAGDGVAGRGGAVRVAGWVAAGCEADRVLAGVAVRDGLAAELAAAVVGGAEYGAQASDASGGADVVGRANGASCASGAVPDRATPTATNAQPTTAAEAAQVERIRPIPMGPV
jgi:hypothetical protein